MRRFLVLIPFLAACQDPCVKAVDRIRARYETCGVSYVEPPADTTCEDAEATAAACTADCVEVNDCGALLGTDMNAAQSLTECLVDCAADTGAG